MPPIIEWFQKIAGKSYSTDFEIIIIDSMHIICILGYIRTNKEHTYHNCFHHTYCTSPLMINKCESPIHQIFDPRKYGLRSKWLTELSPRTCSMCEAIALILNRTFVCFGDNIPFRQIWLRWRGKNFKVFYQLLCRCGCCLFYCHSLYSICDYSSNHQHRAHWKTTKQAKLNVLLCC